MGIKLCQPAYSQGGNPTTMNMSVFRVRQGHYSYSLYLEIYMHKNY